MQSCCLHLGIRVFGFVYLYICMFSVYLCVSVFSFATGVWWNKMNINISPGIKASCLIYSQALLEYILSCCCWSNGYVLLARCYRPWNSRKVRCSFSLFSMKKCNNSATLSLTLILTVIFRADWSDWSDKSEWYCRTVHCCQINLVR